MAATSLQGYKKLSPTQNAAAGFPRKAERYSKPGGGTISKRAYLALQRGSGKSNEVVAKERKAAGIKQPTRTSQPSGGLDGKYRRKYFAEAYAKGYGITYEEALASKDFDKDYKAMEKFRKLANANHSPQNERKMKKFFDEMNMKDIVLDDGKKPYPKPANKRKRNRK